MDQIYNKYSVLRLFLGLSSGISGVNNQLIEVVASALLI